jgi:Abortive infection C-terminus
MNPHSGDFVLEGARRILADWNNPQYLKELIEETEGAVRDGSDRAIDGAKCLIECVCKTILDEHGVAYKKDIDVIPLVKRTASTLGISADQGDGPLRQIASGLTTITQGLAELRNEAGPFGHGKRADHPALRRPHRTLAVITAEAIAVILYEAHVERPLNLKFTRKPYDPEDGINERIDLAVQVGFDADTHEFIINDAMRFRPSQVMYELDREAYIDVVSTLPENGAEPPGDLDVVDIDEARECFSDEGDFEFEAANAVTAAPRAEERGGKVS